MNYNLGTVNTDAEDRLVIIKIKEIFSKINFAINHFI